MPELFTPVAYWVGFHLFLLLLLAAELIFYRTSRATVQRKSVAATGMWIAAALAFAGFVHHTLGSHRVSEYLAGYALEEALSVDNLFIFLLLFRLFKVGDDRQPKVLFWGVSGAIVMRGLFIASGIGLLTRFAWIGYLFGAILLLAAVRLILPQPQDEAAATPPWVKWITRIHPVSLRTDRFFTREQGHFRVTMLFLCLLSIEVADIVFALDSIPAVLSITRHPFLAYTSNIMAVMGLRSLYFLLIGMLARLRFLHAGLAAVLAFAALKMLAAHWIEVGPLVSLGVIVGLLGATAILSIAYPAQAPLTPRA